MSSGRITVALASKSAHKLRVLGAVFADLPLVLVPAHELFPALRRDVEQGASFEDSAREKGLSAAQATGLLTLADASGLEVPALGGRPGVRSARFAHEHATDAENNAALLEALAPFPGEAERLACFRCVLSLVDPWASEGSGPDLAHGRCEGTIAPEARGQGGYGYDPLFRVVGQGGRTLAELTDEERAEVSPRRRAALALAPRLRELLLRRLGEVEHVSSLRPSLIADLCSGR